MLAPALMERLVLVVNHVLDAEPVATERLKAHVGRVIELRLSGWPALLPAPPRLAMRITPAGLLEWCGEAPGQAQADLRLGVEAGNPMLLMTRALSGDRPQVQVDGDAQLAGDVNWLLQNLRWDVAADLERVFGAGIAHQLHRMGSALARGLRAALQASGGIGERRPPSPP